MFKLFALALAFSAAAGAVSAEIDSKQPVDKTLCQRVADLYRSVTDADANETSPIEVLIAAKTLGVSKAEPRGEFSEVTPKEMAAWARLESPPFEFPPDLLKALAEEQSSTLTIDRLPGSNFYAAYRIQGTAYCYNSHYFTAIEGHALRAAEPSAWEGEKGAGCGVNRFFGAIDTHPVAVEVDDKAFSAALGSSLSIAPWEKDHFAPACAVDFGFAPKFSPQQGALGPREPEECSGNDCDDLRKAALALAEKVQQNPPEARQAALARLKTQQKAEYAEMTNEFGEANVDVADPGSLLDTAPLAIPVVSGARGLPRQHWACHRRLACFYRLEREARMSGKRQAAGVQLCHRHGPRPLAERDGEMKPSSEGARLKSASGSVRVHPGGR